LRSGLSRIKTKHLYLFIVFLLLVCTESASLADELPAAVCLYDSVFLDIKSDYTAEAVFKQKYLFNWPGSIEYSSIKIPVNRHVEFSLIEVTHLLTNGHAVSYNKNDIETVSDFSPGYYSDSKTKIIHLPSTRPGAMAVVSYKLKYKSLLYLPQFFRQKSIPTYKSYLEISSKIPFEYYVSANCFKVARDSLRIIIIAENIPSFTYEASMPPVDAYRVVIRPDTISYEDKKYSFQSWSDVAAFYNHLSDDRMLPGLKISSLAESLCVNAGDPIDSVEALFNFVRDNIRYISVDIGRGEFRPLQASEVYKKRYGDCKDQSALLIALCRAVGIKANPALITTRSRPDVITPLPWPGYFNHVITAVDTTNGYLFLDASQFTCCFDHLPPGLRNRRALICGAEPFLEFTFISPYDPGNRLDFELIYKINSSGSFRCDANLKLSRDPAFVFYSKNPEQELADVFHTFFGSNLTRQSQSGFKVNHHSPDFIEISGYFFGDLPKAAKGNRLLVNTGSPFFNYLKKYFYTSQRLNPYSFDFTFSMNETVRLELANNLKVDEDSLVLTFNERGLNSNLSLISGGQLCNINKNFNLYDYMLSGEGYNRFYDFLLIALQAPYNSIEIIPGNIQTEVDSVFPDSL